MTDSKKLNRIIGVALIIFSMLLFAETIFYDWKAVFSAVTMLFIGVVVSLQKE